MVCFASAASSPAKSIARASLRNIVPAIAWAAGSAWHLLPLALLPRALALLAAFDAAPGGHAYTPLLFRTVILEAGFGISLTAGALLSRLV